MMNRLGNAKNEFQGAYERVLCVCSAGLLRSPTAALVLASDPYNFNTRACGLETEYALVPIDKVLIHWADEIVCMESWQAMKINNMPGTEDKSIVCLGIEDGYPYRDPDLIQLIKTRYDALKKTDE